MIGLTADDQTGNRRNRIETHYLHPGNTSMIGL
jgi:hypothetical protein